MELIKFLRGFLSDDSFLSVELNNDMQQEGLFHPRKRTIFINEILTKQGATEIGMDVELYGLIIYLHEFGHATDKELSLIDQHITNAKKIIFEKGFNKACFDEYAFYSYKAEVNAWENAETFIHESYLKELLSVKENSLKLHKDILGSEEELWKLKY